MFLVLVAKAIVVRDTRDLKSLGQTSVWVRIPPRAQSPSFYGGDFFVLPRGLGEPGSLDGEQVAILTLPAPDSAARLEHERAPRGDRYAGDFVGPPLGVEPVVLHPVLLDGDVEE